MLHVSYPVCEASVRCERWSARVREERMGVEGGGRGEGGRGIHMRLHESESERERERDSHAHTNR